jgi:molecular chaperone DnaK
MTIDFGIDLGTTNSLIAHYKEGKVEVYKNPIGWKNTLPSVVAFRKDRVIVGDKAREYVEKDPSNVFGFFKRKMGTPETFTVPNLNADKSPIELSALVLNELKNFIVDAPIPDAVVITIPASFDTIQSNATKKAGYEAGFQEVVLLQEPVAASLAFANSGAETKVLEGQWIVYDLGGGTFDAALVKLEEGEMRVLDHQGDNYLGGLDFDNLIIENLIAPYIEAHGTFRNFYTDLKGKNGRLNRLYYELLFKAEEAKIQLSVSNVAEVEIETEDDLGNDFECVVPVRRQDFEALIRPKIESTVNMVLSLLETNGLTPADLNQVVLVGGSTYIPYVRAQIEQALGVPVNFSVDPTTAVALGAAYYAGGKTKQQNTNPVSQTLAKGSIEVNMAFAKTSQETTEYFTAELKGLSKGMNYRITREDGGYDSGLKPAQTRISEMLPLVRNAFNTFQLRFFDAKSNLIHSDASLIGIIQGKYNLYGQPLPNDICLEVDDVDINATRLEMVFEKNSILPLKKTLFRTISRTINKGSDDSVIINVLEGSSGASPSSCLPLGIISISGRDIPFNLVKGSDVEITLEISESRDLKINVWFAMTSQELENTFNPSERYLNIDKLRQEVKELLFRARKNLEKLEQREDYERAGRLQRLRHELEELAGMLPKLMDEDSGDLKYQMEEQKRQLAQSLDLLFKVDRTEAIRETYFEAKRRCEASVESIDSKVYKTRFEEIIKNEREYLNGDNIAIIKHKIEDLNTLSWEIEQKNPKILAMYFHYFSSIPNDRYLNPDKAQQLKDIGEKALERQNYDELTSIIYGLLAILPSSEKQSAEVAALTGLR